MFGKNMVQKTKNAFVALMLVIMLFLLKLCWDNSCNLWRIAIKTVVCLSKLYVFHVDFKNVFCSFFYQVRTVRLRWMSVCPILVMEDSVWIYWMVFSASVRRTGLENFVKGLSFVTMVSPIALNYCCSSPSSCLIIINSINDESGSVN